MVRESQLNGKSVCLFITVVTHKICIVDVLFVFKVDWFYMYGITPECSIRLGWIRLGLKVKLGKVWLVDYATNTGWPKNTRQFSK